MRLKRTAASYSIVMGFVMIGMWIMFLLTGQVPELRTTPIQIIVHIVAEFITATMLLIGGFGLITNRGWGFKAYLLSMGLFVYSIVYAAGYFGQLGDLVMVAMFAVLFILAVLFIVCSFCQKAETNQPTSSS